MQVTDILKLDETTVVPVLKAAGNKNFATDFGGVLADAQAYLIEYYQKMAETAKPVKKEISLKIDAKKAGDINMTLSFWMGIPLAVFALLASRIYELAPAAHTVLFVGSFVQILIVTLPKFPKTAVEWYHWVDDNLAELLVLWVVLWSVGPAKPIVLLAATGAYLLQALKMYLKKKAKA